MGEPLWPDDVRQGVYDRSRGRCEGCGQRGRPLDLHHRKQRSLGGKEDPANAIACCRLCHTNAHDRNSYSDGWLLRSYEDPEFVPVRMFDGWLLLDDEYGHQPYVG